MTPLQHETALAVVALAMALLARIPGLLRMARPSCPVCGSRSDRHGPGCPWRAHERRGPRR